MPLKDLKIVGLEREIRERFSLDPSDLSDNAMEAINSLIQFGMSPKTRLVPLLNEMTRTIHRFFELQCMSVSMRDPKDGMYRYVLVTGFSPSVIEGYKQIVYSAMDIFDDTSYPSIKISKISRLYMAEDKPYREGEELSYNRPALLGHSDRKNLDDMLIDDYFNFFMYGGMNDVLGWLECAEPRNRKLPTKDTIRWIELIVTIVSMIIIERKMNEK